jgi:hypothetical protein
MQKWPSSAAAAAVVVRVSFWCGFSLTNNSAIWIQHVCKHHAKYRKKTDAATHTHATGSVFQFTTDSNSVLDLLFWLCTFTVNKKQRPAKIKFTLQSWFMPLNELESIFGCADLREWDNNVRLTVVCQKKQFLLCAVESMRSDSSHSSQLTEQLRSRTFSSWGGMTKVVRSSIFFVCLVGGKEKNLGRQVTFP